ncbi:MAG: PilZ domain-containing protein [Oligoflexia bacterium]|nr:PilZ domain-containing protein [Oligoflexia bacterium]
MKLFWIKNLRWGQEFKKVASLYLSFSILISLGIVLEWVVKEINLWGMLLRLAVMGILCRLAYRSMKKLYYTFWFFASLFFLYAATKLFHYLAVDLNWQLAQVYFLVLVVILVVGHILSSPIYYPRVRWWIYDFRYRGDLIIKVRLPNTENSSNYLNRQTFNGRLTDLRRGAGCVLLFERLQVGDRIFIYADSKYSEIRLVAMVVSVREYSLGRGYIHGVKFIFDDAEERQSYIGFSKYWREEIKIKIQQEFEEKQNENNFVEFL